MEKFKGKIKILFVYRSLQSFVERDLEILQKYFDVKPIQWRGKKDLIKIALGILKSNLTFSWFAGDYAAVAVFFSKLFRKKSIVIAGGGDVAYVPEINYGQFTLGWHKRMLTKFALKHTNIVLPVSRFTKNEVLEKVKPKQLKLIYNGVDIEKFKPYGEKEGNLVITVGGIKKSNLKRKGIETFVKSAKFVPEARFVVIGKFIDNSIDYLRSIAPSNVEFTGFVSENELIKWYQKAKVICQLSYYEAFGLTPAEGMACGCIPIVSKERSGMPEFVKDTGFYTIYGDVERTAESIKKALNALDEFGGKAREQIKNFPLERREKKLVQIIDNITQDD